MRKKYVEAMLAAKDAELNAQIAADREYRSLERERLDFEKQKHEDELRVKDRVDVSLKEYEALKNKLAIAEAQLKDCEKLLLALKLDSTTVSGILPDTIQIKTADNVLEGTIMVRVEYECGPRLSPIRNHPNSRA